MVWPRSRDGVFFIMLTYLIKLRCKLLMCWFSSCVCSIILGYICNSLNYALKNNFKWFLLIDCFNISLNSTKQFVDRRIQENVCIWVTFLLFFVCNDDFYAIKHNRTKCAMESSTWTGFFFSQGVKKRKQRITRRDG